jgi:hypothetical protein
MNFFFDKRLQDYINILYNQNLSDDVLRKCDLYLPMAKYRTRDLIQISCQFGEHVSQNHKNASIWHFTMPDDTVVLFIGDLLSVQDKIFSII